MYLCKCVCKYKIILLLKYIKVCKMVKKQDYPILAYRQVKLLVETSFTPQTNLLLLNSVKMTVQSTFYSIPIPVSLSNFSHTADKGLDFS